MYFLRVSLTKDKEKDFFSTAKIRKRKIQSKIFFSKLKANHTFSDFNIKIYIPKSNINLYLYTLKMSR